LTDDHLKQIEELRDVRIGCVCRLKTTSDIHARPESVLSARRDMLRFQEKMLVKTGGGRGGLVVISALPQPLNFLLGQLLKVQVWGSVVLLELVLGKYQLVYSTA
jgi:hypothetical protein